MRDRLLVPGLALVGFAVTLAVTGWPHLGRFQWRGPALPTPVAPPATPVQAVRPTPALPAAPAPIIPAQQVPAQAGEADSAAEAPQPPLPDSSALPSYEADQAARNADALRSARSR